jgi:hypothetical protein
MHWHFVFIDGAAKGARPGLLDFDTWNPRTSLRDAIHQCVYGALCLLVFEYALRIDLSRFFLVLYCSLMGAFILLLWLTAGSVRQVIRREFAVFGIILNVVERLNRLHYYKSYLERTAYCQGS